MKKLDSTKELFTTGEFADLCGVQKQTLFHYDDIGLLKPEYRCKNNYRYYSIQQLNQFHNSYFKKYKDLQNFKYGIFLIRTQIYADCS